MLKVVLAVGAPGPGHQRATMTSSSAVAARTTISRQVGAMMQLPAIMSTAFLHAGLGDAHDPGAVLVGADCMDNSL